MVLPEDDLHRVVGRVLDTLVGSRAWGVADVGSELVTPEAVVLGFDTAGLPSRLLARLLDVMLQVALLIGVLIGLGFLGSVGVPDIGLTIASLFLMIAAVAFAFRRAR